jgi:S1-C subfamily serine protease
MPGLMVIGLEAGGAAHLSGLLIGDFILRVGGESLTSLRQLEDAVQAADRVLVLEVLRAGRLEACEIALARESMAEVA